MSENVTAMYSLFLEVVRLCIEKCIHTKSVSLGPRDPHFVTPLVKSLLGKRRKLRRKGTTKEADKLDVKIKGLICEYRKTSPSSC